MFGIIQKLDGHGGLVRTLVLASFGFIHRFLLTTSESNEEIKILVLYFTKKKKKKNQYLVSIWMLLKFFWWCVWPFFVSPVHCSRDPQVINLCKFFFKIGFHDTIHTFKNYFVTIFLVFSNKRYLNKLLMFKYSKV